MKKVGKDTEGGGMKTSWDFEAQKSATRFKRDRKEDEDA